MEILVNMKPAFVSIKDLLLILTFLLPVPLCAAPGLTPYGHPDEPWDEMLGNHRAIVRTDGKAEAVRVSIPWRRRDADPEKKAVIIHEAATGKRIRNVVLLETSREVGELVFQPEGESRDYYFYYMPLAPHPKGSVLRRNAEYLAPETTAEEAWVRRQSRWRKLPEARVIQFQARTPFDSFYPMEVIASPAEVDDMASHHPNRAYLLFPEDRAHQKTM